jgi:hypothetical protein
MHGHGGVGYPEDMPTHEILLAAPHDLLVGAGPFVAGVVVVLLLLAAVVYGRRKRAAAPCPPRPEEQPLPPDNPAEYETQIREADEVPRDGHRRKPSELRSAGTRRRFRDEPR